MTDILSIKFKTWQITGGDNPSYKNGSARVVVTYEDYERITSSEKGAKELADHLTRALADRNDGLSIAFHAEQTRINTFFYACVAPHVATNDGSSIVEPESWHVVSNIIPTPNWSDPEKNYIPEQRYQSDTVAEKLTELSLAIDPNIIAR